MMPQPSITCPQCGRKSYNPHDVAQGYCGACCDWTSIVRPIDIKAVCPACQTPLVAGTTAAPNPAARRPKRGEVAICTHCGELLAFVDDEATAMRPAELNDLMKLPPEIHREIDAALAHFRAKKAAR